MGKRAVALLSGGLDSGVAMALWLERRHEVACALTVVYAQRSVARELEYACRLAKRFGVPWRSIPMQWLGDLARQSGSAAVVKGPPLPDCSGKESAGDEASAAAVWVPARNVVLIAAAAAVAEVESANVVLAGFNSEEAATFPDNSDAFRLAFGSVLAMGTRGGVSVESPTVNLHKKEIVAAAQRLGLARHDFWSCYDAGPEPCGTCESCVRSARAWQKAGEGDAANG